MYDNVKGGKLCIFLGIVLVFFIGIVAVSLAIALPVMSSVRPKNVMSYEHAPGYGQAPSYTAHTYPHAIPMHEHGHEDHVGAAFLPPQEIQRQAHHDHQFSGVDDLQYIEVDESEEVSEKKPKDSKGIYSILKQAFFIETEDKDVDNVVNGDDTLLRQRRQGRRSGSSRSDSSRSGSSRRDSSRRSSSRRDSSRSDSSKEDKPQSWLAKQRSDLFDKVKGDSFDMTRDAFLENMQLVRQNRNGINGEVRTQVELENGQGRRFIRRDNNRIFEDVMPHNGIGPDVMPHNGMRPDLAMPRFRQVGIPGFSNDVRTQVVPSHGDVRTQVGPLHGDARTQINMRCCGAKKVAFDKSKDNCVMCRK